MKLSFLNLLRESSKVNPEVNQDMRLKLDQEILTRKPKFWEVVSHIQRRMVDQASNFNIEAALNIELGAGVLPMKINYPKITSTDVVPANHLDGILDATNLDLPDDSVQNIFLQNTFHHIPNPQDFFEESLRVLKSGGRIIIVDPYFNRLSRLLYPRLFATESFELMGSWDDASEHAMVGRIKH